MPNSGPRLSAAARMVVSAAAFAERERAAVRHEHLVRRDVLAAGRRHAHRVPGVDDLVVGLRHHAEPRVDRLVAVEHRGGEHVPVRIVDAGGERPAAADDESAVDLARAAGRERDRGRDQRVRVRVPDLVLGVGMVVAEDPVVAAEIADVPGGRRAAARDHVDDVDERHERQLHPAERFRLMEPEQPGLVQQLLVLAREHAGVFRRLRALAQHRHYRARPPHRFVVIDAGEIAARLRQRADETGRVVHGVLRQQSAEIRSTCRRSGNRQCGASDSAINGVRSRDLQKSSA